jgi:replicative DNA helicase
LPEPYGRWKGTRVVNKPDVVLAPHNAEAEQALLGALLLQPGCYDRISDFFHAGMFYMPVHVAIYQAIERELERGAHPTPITLKDEFAAHPDLDKAGGGEYLTELAAGVVSLASVRDYAEHVGALHVRRGVLAMAQDIAYAAQQPDGQEDDLLAEAERRLTALADNRAVTDTRIGDAAGAALAHMEAVARGEIRPVRTGIWALDEKIQGIFNGGLYVLAARPGMGKTACGLTIADNVAKTGTPCLFISLEMGADELSQRLMASRSGVSVDRQRAPQTLTQEDWGNLNTARADLVKIPITVAYKAGATTLWIKTAARRFKRKFGKDGFVLFIDYLGLIANSSKQQNKSDQIAEITAGLKGLAKELNAPVVLLCQLNRGVEARDDKRPGLADLRDSGAIEQDADVVMFIYREAYYLEREKPRKKPSDNEQKYMDRLADWEAQKSAARNAAEIVVDKNRQGQRGVALLSFDGERQVFA